MDAKQGNGCAIDDTWSAMRMTAVTADDKLDWIFRQAPS